MKLKGFVKMAAAMAAALVLTVPVKADASEIIESAEFGDILVFDVEDMKGIVFAEESDEAKQFIKEAAADPYFVRYNYMDATLARLKAGATSITVLDDDGNVIGIKSGEAIRQDVMNHLAIVGTLNAMTPEEIQAMENYQLAMIDEQEELLDYIRAEMEADLKEMIRNKDEEAEGARLLLDIFQELQKVLDAKRKTVHAYQQQAEPEKTQLALLEVQDHASKVQQSLLDFCKLYDAELRELFY